MKIPRDISGKQLIKLLEKLNYIPTKQSGSHIRLTTQKNGQHHVTIPDHVELRIGTINAILTDIAAHLVIPKSEIIDLLFGE